MFRVTERSPARRVIVVPVNKVLIGAAVAALAFGGGLWLADAAYPSKARVGRAGQLPPYFAFVVVLPFAAGFLLAARGQVVTLDKEDGTITRRRTGPFGGQVRRWPLAGARLRSTPRTVNGVTGWRFAIDHPSGGLGLGPPSAPEAAAVQADLLGFLASGPDEPAAREAGR